MGSASRCDWDWISITSVVVVSAVLSSVFFCALLYYKSSRYRAFVGGFQLNKKVSILIPGSFETKLSTCNFLETAMIFSALSSDITLSFLLYFLLIFPFS